MKKLQILIIDDEQDACDLLVDCLQTCGFPYEISGMAHTVETGIQLIEQTQPDLVLLDVQLSPGTGFDILNHFDQAQFKVIFTTAHEQYAINAIRFSAIDYLLKPIDPNELNLAVSRARDKVLMDSTGLRMDVLKEIISSAGTNFSRIVLPTIDGFKVELTQDICYCQADRNYTCIFLSNGKKYVVSKTLKVYEQMLSNQGFFRTHVSFLLNLAYVKEYKRQKKGGTIFLQDDTEIPLAEGRKKEFLAMFP